MHTVYSLRLHHWIPVRFDQVYVVCHREINTNMGTRCVSSVEEEQYEYASGSTHPSPVLPILASMIVQLESSLNS